LPARFPRSVWIAALLALVTALAIASDLTPWLRGGFGWRWEYLPVKLSRILPLTAAAVVYLAVAWLLLRREARTVYMLLWSLLGAVIVALTAAYARDGDLLYALFTRTVSLVASGEHWGGATINWAGGEWRDWTATMARYSGNIGTSPPGTFWLYGLTAAVIDRVPGLANTLYRDLLPLQCHNYDLLIFTRAEWGSAWLGMLSPLWAALTVLPVYGIAHRLSGHAVARQAALWWPLIPGMAAFVTSSSTVFPLVAALVFWLLVRGLHSPPGAARVLWLVAAGMMYGTGLLLNFVFLPLAALYGIYTLLHGYFNRKRTGVQWIFDPVRVGLWVILGTALPWLLFLLLTGQTFFDLLIQSLSYHLELDRPYAFWVWMHVWDWALWTGPAFVVLAGAGLWHWFRRDRVESSMSRNKPPLLLLALLLSVLALTLSGTTRGESGRIWLFFAPFAVITAAQALHRLAPATEHRSWLAVAGAQAMLLIALITSIEAYPAPDLSPPPAPPMVEAERAVDARFSTASGESFRLTAWDAEQQGDSLVLRTQWQGESLPLEPYWFAAVLAGPDGITHPVEAWQPADAQGERYPTTCWNTGQMIGTTQPFPLPEDAAPGDWYISLAAFGDNSTPEGRLRVTTSEGDDVQIGLGPVMVEPFQR
jgi:hypothetical protein